MSSKVLRPLKQMTYSYCAPHDTERHEASVLRLSVAENLPVAGASMTLYAGLVRLDI